MQIVSNGDNLHEMSNPVFYKKKSKKNVINLLSAEIFTKRVEKVKQTLKAWSNCSAVQADICLACPHKLEENFAWCGMFAEILCKEWNCVTKQKKQNKGNEDNQKNKN